MPSETEKYPVRIQKLFTPKLPPVYTKPADYPIERRCTSLITPISQWKEQYAAYVKELTTLDENQPRTISATQSAQEKAKKRREAIKNSLLRQQNEWAPPNIDKSPYNTVFVLRLDYSATELDLSEAFKSYGVIESIKIIRDHDGKSRGYGFVVFERDSDALACVQELARTGVQVISLATGKSRAALVDIERGRIVRNWKPSRLGGGHGGRHYTKPTGRINPMASAAASGRRINIQQNYQAQHGHRGGYQNQYLAGLYNSRHSTGYLGSHQASAIPPRPAKPQSVRDKYAKYNY